MSILKPSLSGNYLGSLFIKEENFESRVQGNILYIKPKKYFQREDNWCDINLPLWEEYDIDTLVIEKVNFNNINKCLYLRVPQEISNIKIFNKNKDLEVILPDITKVIGDIELENVSIDLYNHIIFRVEGNQIYGGFHNLEKYLEETKSITGSGTYGIRVLVNQYDNFKKIIKNEIHRFRTSHLKYLPMVIDDYSGILHHLNIKL